VCWCGAGVCRLEAVEDARGQKDLFGRSSRSHARPWPIIWYRQPDRNGEGDEGIPAAIIRDSSIPIREVSGKIHNPPRNACTLAHWALDRVLTPEDMTILFEKARVALNIAYAPYSGFKVGQHFYLRAAGSIPPEI